MSPGVSSFDVTTPGIPTYEVLLDPLPVIVGRAEDCGIALRDMNVSRHHFEIDRRPDGLVVLRDKGSRNGTMVNRVHVFEKILVEGDRVTVGGSSLVFRAQSTGAALQLDKIPRPTSRKTRRPGSGPNEATFRRSGPPAVAETIRQPVERLGVGLGFGASPAPAAPTTPPPAPRPALDPPTDSATPRPAPVPISQAGAKLPFSDAFKSTVERPIPKLTDSDLGDLPSDELSPHHDARWRKLAEVACAINLERDVDALLEKILDAVLTLVPSNSGCLILRNDEELEVRANRNAPDADLDDESEGGYRISRQVCQEAIAQQRPLLTQDAANDDQLGQFMSVMNLKLKSILCVPFAFQGDVLGVVYLDEPQIDVFAEDAEAVELVAAFGDLAGIALANARLLQETATRERLEKELQIASRIQNGLVPAGPPPCQGLEIAGQMRPARAVGGDLFDFIRREQPSPEVLVAIGDVSGKGVGAGLVMSTTRSLLRATCEDSPGTDQVLVRMNRHLHRDLEGGMFVSFLLLRYEEATGRVAFAGAGHEHLVLYRPSTGQQELMRAGGVVLGVVSDISGRIQERELYLQPGDVVCLYTDGVTEAADPAGEEFGLERVVEALKAGPLDPQTIVERIFAAVEAFADPRQEQHDDITVVALRKT